jgi:predicted NodU family carbamoyl transferase
LPWPHPRNPQSAGAKPFIAQALAAAQRAGGGVTPDGEKARLFGPETENADPEAFAERCEKDRHHFRFIVSPEDAAEMADLKGFAASWSARWKRIWGPRSIGSRSITDARVHSTAAGPAFP